MSKRRKKRRGKKSGLNGVKSGSKAFTVKKGGMALGGAVLAGGIAILGGALGSYGQSFAWGGILPVAVGLYLDETNQGNGAAEKRNAFWEKG